MKKVTKGVAKRLIFSLVALSALGGCAVYGPPGPYAYGTDANGQPIYAAAPVNVAPPYYYPYYYNPVYVGPPVSFNFGFYSRHGGGFHGGGGRGFHGGGRR